MGKALVPSHGFKPEGTYTRIISRFDLASKHSMNIGGGVIDVGVIFDSHSYADFEVKIGYPIAQLIIQMIRTPEVTQLAFKK
ncbi:hypothetical protein L6452_39286 [Arctium lappa]|uniref:Uncharacterized protein n=1 Tax=Arctium lappa TaxID=4217 RepID=A0ACB8XRE2_ARCLA|nr:hypothetical protein L6452_39286 [Arctium lappa]